jgi:alpha-L-fucosidase
MGPGTFTKNVAVIPMIRAAIPTILLVLAPAAGRGQGPAASAPAPYGATPSARQRAWHEREIYGFVHFTINTFTDREWGQGDEAESLFAPTALDCQQWARVAKEAGLRGLILTAKHHDGFCLWPSAFTEHSVTRSPWKGGKGDVVRELSEACQRNGLAFGVYLSPWDRNHKDYGRPEYLTYYRSQLKELLTGYGPLFEVWFDGANGGDGYYGGAREKRVIDASHYYDWPNTTKIVRELQPGAVMFSDAGPDVRWVGNERGTAGETTWQTFDLAGHFAGHEHPKQTEGHRAGDTWLPPETDVSIRPGWFHHTSEDSKVKTAKQLVDIYFESVGRGSNLLLNIPPDRRGLFHENDVESLRGMRKILDGIFTNDLARGKAATASRSRGGDPNYAPARSLDGDAATYWVTDDAPPAAGGDWLAVDFGAPTTFDVVGLREAIALGQRVDAFALDAWKDGKWKEIAAGTSIGPRRLLRFPKVTAEKLRLRIVKAAAAPCIAELAVHCQP